jgi:hypothetical protein
MSATFEQLLADLQEVHRERLAEEVGLRIQAEKQLEELREDVKLAIVALHRYADALCGQAYRDALAILEEITKKPEEVKS